MSRLAELEQEISTEVRRLLDRLAVFTPQRLAAPAPPYASRAAAVHALAQRFVDITADLEGAASVPSLLWVDELVVVDQLAVTHQDLRFALEAHRNRNDPEMSQRLTDLLADVRRIRVAVG